MSLGPDPSDPARLQQQLSCHVLKTPLAKGSWPPDPQKPVGKKWLLFEDCGVLQGPINAQHFTISHPAIPPLYS